MGSGDPLAYFKALPRLWRQALSVQKNLRQITSAGGNDARRLAELVRSTAAWVVILDGPAWYLPRRSCS
jgi:hypothetical protein